VVSTPAVKDGKVIFGRTGDYKVYARDTKTGATLWQTKTGYFIYGSPAIAGKTVYIGSFNGMLYALDLDSGKIKWKFPTKGCQELFGEFFTYGGEFDQKVYNTMGSKKAPGQNDYEYLSQAGIVSSPWVTDDSVNFAGADGGIYAVDIK
jgi:outer membrane protein assembly factor BamB